MFGNGWGSNNITVKRKPRVVKKRVMKPRTPTEENEQIGFVNWFHFNFPNVLIFHINNSSGHIATRKRLKAMGQVAGIPDLMIPSWGVWVEMKRVKGGVVSDEQEQIHRYLTGIGDTVIVGYGAEDASRQILRYRKLKWKRL